MTQFFTTKKISTFFWFKDKPVNYVPKNYLEAKI